MEAAHRNIDPTLIMTKDEGCFFINTPIAHHYDYQLSSSYSYKLSTFLFIFFLHIFIYIIKAYSEGLVCEMWQLFGSFASRLNYTSYRSTDCSSYFPIPSREVSIDGEDEINAKPSTLGVRRRKEIVA